MTRKEDKIALKQLNPVNVGGYKIVINLKGLLFFSHDAKNLKDKVVFNLSFFSLALCFFKIKLLR